MTQELFNIEVHNGQQANMPMSITCFTNQQEVRITSLQIAEITGKPHNDVLKAIRRMESAWEKVSQGKFSLSSYQQS